jgi:hypothetical protein
MAEQPMRQQSAAVSARYRTRISHRSIARQSARLVVFMPIVLLSHIGLAEEFSAKSPSLRDVSEAVAAARDGDVVSVPSGTAVWTAPLTISKHITLRGTGAGSTVIVDEVKPLVTKEAFGRDKVHNPRPQARPRAHVRKENRTLPAQTGGKQRYLLFISLEKDLPFRMTGLTFRGGDSNVQKVFNGLVRISGNSHSLRIDHCTFDQLHGTNLALNGFLWGVVDHCRFNTASVHPITIKHDRWNGATFGNGSWADNSYWGSEKFLFIEDNVFENSTNKSAIDAFEGARFVVRHNQFHNCGVTAHGTEGQGRGTKQIEEYDNSYNWDNARGGAAQIRSGSIVTFNNKSKGLMSGHVLQVYRPFHKSPHWGPVNGKNLYDDNEPKSVTGYWERGTHTGASGSFDVVDSTKNWTTNQWYSPGSLFMVRNITTESASTLNYVWALANTSNTITCSKLVFESDQRTTFNKGDVYEIWKVNRALDQPGSGKTVLLQGMGNWPSTAQPMNQANEPCYSWNNKNAVTGADIKLTASGPQIKEGRDFFNGTPKPGYTPYTYPHPLTGPAPPTNLQIASQP